MKRQRIIGQLAFKDNKNDEIIPLDLACEIVLAGKYWWARITNITGRRGQWQLQDHEMIKHLLSETVSAKIPEHR